MQRILITGNGFDLHFGLPTKFENFISITEYLEKTSNPDFQNIFKKLDINLDEEELQTLKINKELLHKLKSIAESNIWYIHFKNEIEIETWIDFEIEIESVIQSIYNSIDSFQNDIFLKSSHDSNRRIYLSNKKFEFLSNVRIYNILKSFKLLFKDDQKNGPHLNDSFLGVRNELFFKIDIPKYSNFILEEFEKFKVLFSTYLKLIIVPLSEIIIPETDTTLFEKFNQHFTFNYTPTFESLVSSKTKTEYLHGNLQNNNIVIGVDEIDVTSEFQKSFLPFTKYFQKISQETDYNFIEPTNPYTLRDYYTFLFFGHSLNKSDMEYINQVFDLVHKEQLRNMVRIIVAYHNKIAKSTLLLNLLNLRGRDNIVYLMKNKILLFCETNSQDLEEAIKMNFNDTRWGSITSV